MWDPLNRNRTETLPSFACSNYTLFNFRKREKKFSYIFKIKKCVRKVSLNFFSKIKKSVQEILFVRVHFLR